jgi:hypothetical protein
MLWLLLLHRHDDAVAVPLLFHQQSRQLLYTCCC